MIPFALLATLLLVVAVLAFLLPLWRGRGRASEADRKAANLAIFRDQLAELEREQAEGTLAEADFSQARGELQKRLLEEVEGGEVLPTAASPSRKTGLALVLLIPILAVLAYGILGNPRALDPAEVAGKPQMTPEQINAMVAKLAERMQANPDDLQGWVMLGRSYKALGRYADAAEAFAKGEKIIADDPDLLASYAETLAMAGGKGLAGKPRQLVEKALKIAPEHGHSLFLAGAAAMEAGDNVKGIAYWQKVLPQVEPGSDVEKMIQDGIAKMQAELKKGGKATKK